jgi:hypothetical protein
MCKSFKTLNSAVLVKVVLKKTSITTQCEVNMTILTQGCCSSNGSTIRVTTLTHMFQLIGFMKLRGRLCLQCQKRSSILYILDVVFSSVGQLLIFMKKLRV